jgi:hypothetical protein
MGLSIMLTLGTETVDTRYCNEQRRRGAVPFGWSVAKDGSMVEHKQHQEMILLMVEARHDGRSYRAIAETLRGRGVTLSHEGVRKILAAAADRGVDIVAARAWRAAAKRSS